MKLMIASDIHGSQYYCQAVLDTFRKSGAEKLLLLGDLLYHGARNDLPRDYSTKEVTALLNANAENSICVRGNCDSEVDQMVLQFPLSESCWIRADGVEIFAAHGHNWGPDRPPILPKGAYLLCGHIHLPVCQDCGSYTYINPGSASIPFQDTPHSYMLLEDGVFSWRELLTDRKFTPLASRN